MKSKEAPTLSDVARVAGVSPITVSRLMNGGSRVRPDTARRIRSAVARLGYEPNEAARILKGQPAKVLGLVVPDLADSFYGACAQAVHEVARDRSYMTVLVGCGGRSDIELLEIAMMVRRRTAGLLLIPTGTDKRNFKMIRDAKIPMVCFDRSLPGFDVDAVVVNNRDSSRDAVKHLIGHGHKNIVCLGNQSNIYPIRHRIQGYEDGMREAGLSTVIIDRADAVDEVDSALVRLMQLKRPPTAIFSVNNVATLLLLQVAARRGYRMPDQLALIGFDDFQMATLLKPSITVVRQPVVEMSRRAACILLDQLNSSAQHTTATVILATELIIRESCGCRLPKFAESPASLLSRGTAETQGLPQSSPCPFTE